MAALVWDDLTTPKGRLVPEVLWPLVGGGYDVAAVTAKLTGFLVDAVVRTGGDVETQQEAQRQWAYYRAYQEVYELMVRMPSSGAVTDQASYGYTDEQIALMGELAAQALALFEGLIPSVTLMVPTPASYSAPNRFTW